MTDDLYPWGGEYTACSPHGCVAVIGEDPYFTRRNVASKPEYIDRAFAAAVPFYPEIKQKDIEFAVKSIRSQQVMNLQSFDWSKLVSLLKQQGQTRP